MSSKILIHIPHSSMNIPKEYKNSFTADTKTIKKNIIALTDYQTQDLYNHPEHQNKIIFKVSRLLCDVERFEKDQDEIMAKYGMGVVYTKGPYGETLRTTNENIREEIIEKYYKPHHKKLLEEVTRIIEEDDRCIIIDAHSFPSKPFPGEPNQNMKRPDFCIGTDKFHTPKTLVNNISNCIKEMGYSIELNKPYAGTIVPLELYGKDKRVISVMIEVNRRLYMNETEQSPSEGYYATKKAIHKIIDSIDKWAQE